MTTHATGYARYGGLHLAWESRGVGPTNFVMVPFLGVFGRSALAAFPGLRATLGALSREGKVVIYDPRGTGDSSPGPIPTTVDELAEDLENVIQASESAPAWLLVHHDAAPAAIALAVKRSDLVAGMLFDSSFARFSLAEGYKEGAAASTATELRQALAVDPVEGLTGLLRRYYGMADTVAADAARRVLGPLDEEAQRTLTSMFLQLDVRDRLKASIVPVLVTHGTADRLVPVAASRYLATHLGNKDFRQFEGAPHFLMNAAGPQWLDEVRRFVRRRSTTPAG